MNGRSNCTSSLSSPATLLLCCSGQPQVRGKEACDASRRPRATRAPPQGTGTSLPPLVSIITAVIESLIWLLHDLSRDASCLLRHTSLSIQSKVAVASIGLIVPLSLAKVASQHVTGERYKGGATAVSPLEWLTASASSVPAARRWLPAYSPHTHAHTQVAA